MNETLYHIVMGILGLLVIVLAIGLYFAPSIAAVNQGKRNAGAVFVLNFFLGWTLIGWVVALVWALTEDAEAVQMRPAR